MFIRLAAVAALTLAVAPASAALVADYQLNGTLADALGGPDISNNGGTLGTTGITFGAGQGPSLGGFANTGVYSVEIGFRFADVAGYRRILDFKNQSSDTGLYVLNGALNFFNITTGSSGVFAPDTLVSVLFTRDAAGTATGYINGSQQISFADTGNLASIVSTLNFFNDDLVVSGEQSAGFVDFIRIYDTAIAPGVPEPATWALLLAGFGLTGAALRRRTPVAVRG